MRAGMQSRTTGRTPFATRRAWRHWAVLLGACVAPWATAGEDAYPWLQRMNEALASRNYDGTFFHVRDGRVETLRIIHRVDGDQVHERLVSLDGSGREFIRSGAELTCILPDQRTVLVERSASPAPLLGNLPRFDPTTASYYEVDPAETTRLMGRDARLVVVRPRDAYRYGYRLWIDEKTAMPLKTQLCDGSGKVIEQIVFASLTLPTRIPDSAFQSQTPTDGFRWLRHDGLSAASGLVAGTRAGSAGPEAALASSPTWGVTRLPPGFRLTKRSEQRLPGIERPVSHLVFSDGVASVSVFIQNAADGQPAASVTGASQIGPSAAYSARVNGHVVTAVGEVPAGTVRMIATTVRQQGRSDALPPPGPVQAERSRSGGAAEPAPRDPETLRRPSAVPALAPTEPRR
ncbi:MAG: MucB/RseB C-terminal domain-containing protein [Steroidobacteraceae bacterium]